MLAGAGALLARGIPYYFPAFLGVWGTHLLLTELGDPFGLWFDFGLWIVASALKAGALLSLLVVLSLAHRRIHHNLGRATSALAVWSTAGVLLLLVLAGTRAWWAPLLRSDAIEYFSPAVSSPGGAELARQSWLGPWQAGHVVTLEVGLMVVLAAIHAGLGYFFGNRPLRSAAIASGLTIALLTAFLYFCPWFHLDYDNFHGDILAGALVFDQVLLVASDPYTTLAATTYTTFLLASLAYLRLVPVTAPKRT